MHKHFSRAVTYILLSVSLCSCASFRDGLRSLNQTEQMLTGAESITTDFKGPNGENWNEFYKFSGDPDKQTYLGYIVDDSAKKCELFKGGISASTRASDTLLDFGTTVFAALGTAFSPLSTVHALTAAAAITSGTKSAIDADIYQKETAALIVQQINNTYYSDLKDYLKALPGKTDVNVGYEVASIRTFHTECSLDAAVASLQKNASPSPPTPPSKPVGGTTPANVQGATTPAAHGRPRA
jgi:hypothetical protein